MQRTEPHHRTALLAALAATVLVVVLGPLGLIVGGVLLVGVGRTLPRESASRLALLLVGTTLVVVVGLTLFLFGVGGDAQVGGALESGGSEDRIAPPP